MASDNSIRLPKDSRLVVLDEETRPYANRRIRFVKCRCACGAVKWIQKCAVTTGHVLSCGCLWLEKITRHKMSSSRAYRCWQKMLARCENKRDKRYADYGGRGITVCQEWHDFVVYFQHITTLLPHGATDVPKHLTVDRIENSKGYEPGNIRLATAYEQQRNTRSNHVIEIDGVSKCVAEWALQFGINKSVIYTRIQRGWNPILAVTTKPEFSRSKQRTAAS